MCAVMAAITNFRVLYILYFIYFLNEISIFSSSTAIDKTIIYTDSYGLITDGLLPRIYERIFFCNHVNIGRRNCESNFKITLAFNKSAKHGSTCLALPSKPFVVDLTIYIDVESNPGPDTAEIILFGSECSRSAPLPMCLSENLFGYKPSYFRTLRSSPLTKHIDPKTHYCLRLLGILKPSRGRKSGKKVKYCELANNVSNIHGSQRRGISIPDNVGVASIPSNHTQKVTANSINKSTGKKEFVPSLILTNTMSLAPKIDEVRYFVTSKKPDLAFITETWLTDSIDTCNLTIPEYNIVCKNRTSGAHGGVCLYIKNSIHFTILDKLNSPEFEVLWVKIRPNRLPRGFPCIVTGTLYHPPSSDDKLILDYLVKSITAIESLCPGCGILLAGDFNSSPHNSI